MKIIAHRGIDNIHRENSFLSIVNSLNKDYVDGVEFDIRITRDKTFVINHDPFYYEYFIKETDSKILKRLGLNTLDEVLRCINNDKLLLIDVKTDDIEDSYYLFKILKKYSLNYYICSFNYKFINYFHKKYKIKSGLLIGSKINLKYINNDLDFNSISYKYKGIIPNKETFIWTVNKKIKTKYNIITDRPKEMYDYFKKT